MTDRLRDRVGTNRVTLWLLMDADRRLVAGAFAAVVFLGLSVVGLLVPEASAAIRSGDPVETLFQATLTATVTGVTLVVTLNQLVLSQELGAAGDQRERMTEATTFRADVAEAVGRATAPARPSEFLRVLVVNAAERTRRLRRLTDTTTSDERDAVGDRSGDDKRTIATDRDAAGDRNGDDERTTATDRDAARDRSGDDERVTNDDDLDRVVAVLADGIVESATDVADRLETATFGPFDAVSVALDFDYSWALVTAQRIAARDELDAETSETLAGLIETLELFGAAREHVKTLYFQWELIELSRAIFVASLPALLVSGAMTAFVRPSVVGSVAVGGVVIDGAIVVVAAALAVALLPFFVLLSSILRIAVVAKQTLSIGPFILQTSEQAGRIDPDD